MHSSRSICLTLNVCVCVCVTLVWFCCSMFPFYSSTQCIWLHHRYSLKPFLLGSLIPMLPSTGDTYLIVLSLAFDISDHSSLLNTHYCFQNTMLSELPSVFSVSLAGPLPSLVLAGIIEFLGSVLSPLLFPLYTWA